MQNMLLIDAILEVYFNLELIVELKLGCLSLCGCNNVPASDAILVSTDVVNNLGVNFEFDLIQEC